MADFLMLPKTDNYSAVGTTPKRWDYTGEYMEIDSYGAIPPVRVLLFFQETPIPLINIPCIVQGK